MEATSLVAPGLFSQENVQESVGDCRNLDENLKVGYAWVIFSN
jgi:hypothetical protein